MVVKLTIHLAMTLTLTMAKIETALGCDNTTLNIFCSRDQLIKVVRANYGRFSITVCNPAADLNLRTDCDSKESSTYIVKNM